MSLYQPKGTAIWWLNLRDQMGKRIRESTHCSDKAAAQRVHNQRQIALWSEAESENSGCVRTWGDARKAWLQAETRSESEVYSLSKFERDFPDRCLPDITAEHIERALSFCKTPSTYMRYRAMVMAILNLAKNSGWLTTLPKIAARRDKKTKPRVRAGLGKFTDAGYEGFTWHGFRHTWATWHVQNGTPLDVLQKLGGWADLRMVMNYAHHAPSHLASYAGNTGTMT